MPNTTPSTNMNMPIPVAGVDPGPQWALDVNACLAILDGHDHTTGNGVPISPSGMNISSDLTFQGNNATFLRTSRYSSQSGVLTLPADLDCLYVVNGDLYFNDGLANNVRITQSGGVAGSPGSISNLNSPASASYVAGSQSFVWQSDANTPANLDCASIILRNLVANSKELTLNPPASMGSDISQTLPTIPSSASFMQMSNLGVMSASVAVSGGITTTNIAAATIANSNMAPGQTDYTTMVTKSSNFNTATTDGTYIMNTASANVTATLQTATGSGKRFTFRKSSAAHQAIIARSGSDTINGNTSITMNALNESISLYDAASGAWIIECSGFNPLVFRGHGTGGQSSFDNADAIVSLGNTDIDNRSAWSTNIFTVPAGFDGCYQVGATIVWNGSGGWANNSQASISYRINGGSSIPLNSWFNELGHSASVGLSGSDVVKQFLVAGNTIEFIAFQNSGGGTKTLTTAQGYITRVL